MRVLCRHGHFAFYPRRAEEVAKFATYYGTPLVRDGDFYTFPLLKSAPRHSIVGLPFLNLPALVNYEGRGPWDVMRENGFVFSIATKLLVPKASIVIAVDPPLAGYAFISQTPLIQPGSLNSEGLPLLSYDGEYLQNTFVLKVSEFAYE